MLQEYKANGAFNKYHIDRDGNPASTTTENIVADDIIDSFMDELDLMAQSMKVYGMEEKSAIEAYEGDIELFTQITNVVTNMQRIKNAIQSGVENNLHEGLITKEDTIDTLQEKLKVLEQEYNYLELGKE